MSALPNTPPYPGSAALTSALFERHGAKIFAHCLSRLKDRRDAEDAVQIVFLNAFRSIERGEAPELEQAWLFAIANRVISDRRRTNGRRRRVESPHDPTDLVGLAVAPPSEREELFHLERALEALPDHQRRAVLLREWQGLSYAEIASDLHLSQGAVEQLLFRARRSLAEKLNGPARRTRSIQLWALLARLKDLVLWPSAAKVAAVAAVAATAGGTVALPKALSHVLAATQQYGSTEAAHRDVAARDASPKKRSAPAKRSAPPAIGAPLGPAPAIDPGASSPVGEAGTSAADLAQQTEPSLAPSAPTASAEGRGRAAAGGAAVSPVKAVHGPPAKAHEEHAKSAHSAAATAPETTHGLAGPLPTTANENAAADHAPGASAADGATGPPVNAQDEHADAGRGVAADAQAGAGPGNRP